MADYVNYGWICNSCSLSAIDKLEAKCWCQVRSGLTIYMLASMPVSTTLLQVNKYWNMF